VIAIAKSYEHAYENAEGKRVEIQFREILEVQEVLDQSIKDGSETFSRFWHNPTPQDFTILRTVHESAWWVRKEPESGDSLS
jgi:hypothetical protein